MDRPALDALYSIAELAVQTLGDFTGGFVGEGEDTDFGRIDIETLDQVTNALDEAECLSRAGAGENEERLGKSFDCRAL